MTGVTDVLDAPWAIRPANLLTIRDAYDRHARGEPLDRAAVEARIGKPLGNERQSLTVDDGVALISLHGVLAKRMNLFMEISGGTSMQIAAAELRRAIDDPAIRTIVLHVDSPGGTVDGTHELAELVYSARASKRVIAVADGVMCSAAYWIGSAASELYITSPTAVIGSIGVVATHRDVSRREEQLGVKTSEIVAGKYKRAASQFGPLTKEGRETLQTQVDAVYGVFLDAVGRNRGGLSADVVHKQMADGREFIGRDAIAAGLVDDIATLSEALQIARNNLGGGLRRGPGASSSPAPETAAASRPSPQAQVAPEVVVDPIEGARAMRVIARTRGLVDAGMSTADAIEHAEREEDMPSTVARMRELMAEDPKLSPAAALARVNARCDDPQAIAARATAYQARMREHGIKVTAAEAVAHVTREKR